MSKFSKIAAAVAVVPVLAFSAPVFADSPGQLEGGSNFYQVKNTSVAGAQYGASTTVAACGDVLQFSIELHNTETNPLTSISLKATLGASSTATATPSVANAGATGTVAVNGLTAGETVDYVSGSTKLYSGANNSTVVNEADGIVSNDGVNVGDLLGSETKFVNFQAKVNCAPGQIKVCDLTTKKIVVINESDFNSAKHTKDLTKCQTPTVLVNTGPGSVVAIAAAVAAASAVAYSVVTRRLSRQ